MGTFQHFIGPALYSGNNALSGFANVTIDADAKTIAYIVQAEEACTVTKLGFRYASSAGTVGTQVAHRISAQTVSGGNATGVLLGATNNAKAAFTPNTTGGTWTNNTWHDTGDGTVAALTETFDVTRGMLFAIVIESTGTTSVGTAVTFSGALSGFTYSATSIFPDWWFNGAKQNYVPVYSYSSASRRYGNPIVSATSAAFSQDTSGADEYGVAFTLQSAAFAAGTTFQVNRFQWDGTTGATGKTVNINLYTNVTQRQQFAWDETYNQNPTVTGRPGPFFFTDTTLWDCSPGTEYIIGLQPQSTATNVRLNTITVPAAADRQCYPGAEDLYLAKRLDVGSWDLTNTSTIPFVNIGLKGFTPPAGAGGISKARLQLGM